MTPSTPLVLVVDDEIELCRRIARLLERGGYRAMACYSVEEAQQILLDEDVSVLISDVTMPGISGLELLEQVMQPGSPPLGVVMMTGFDDTDTALRAQELGAHGYLTKPFHRNALLISVSGALHRVKLEEENQAYRLYLEGELEERTVELESSRRTASAMINRTSDALVLIDESFTIKYASAAVSELFGYSAEDILGLPVDQFLRHEDLAAIAEARGVALDSGEPVTMDVQIHRADGSFLWCEGVGESHFDDPAIAGFVVSLRNIEGRRRRSEELEKQARQDQLTGLPNRYALAQRLQQAIDEVDTGLGLSAVIFLDLDRLKVINDSLGHEIGDTILKTVAERLRSSIRPTDMVARFGGDEFVMVCSGFDSTEDAVELAERVGSTLGAPIEIGERSFHVTAATGIAMVTRDYHDPDDLVRDADAAVYQAKSSGRASIRAFDPTTHDQALRRLDYEASVRSGAAHDEWELHYQPQCSMSDRKVVGFEALVRWRHPERGLLMPDQFISVLEDAGLISELDDFVLREACRFAVSPGIAPLGISVNVSAGQLLSEDFPSFVMSVLDETGLPSERLTIEITESGMIQDLAVARRTLMTLRDLGVHLSVDDFGTGFSALSYLAELPVTELKIDRSFVSKSKTPGGRDLLEGIVSLAASMSLACVAEGVETEDEFALLAGAGCATFQGYLISPAVPANEARSMLASQAWRVRSVRS